MIDPLLVWTMIETSLFEYYQAAFLSDRYIPWAHIITPFCSIVVSYRGVTSAFELRRFWAMFWFLILPAMVYRANFSWGALLTL